MWLNVWIEDEEWKQFKFLKPQDTKSQLEDCLKEILQDFLKRAVGKCKKCGSLFYKEKSTEKLCDSCRPKKSKKAVSCTEGSPPR